MRFKAKQFLAVLTALAILFALLPATAMAAYGTWYVVEGGTGAEDGTDWDNAFDSIQTAIDAAAPGDTIIVVAGEYIEEDPIVIDKNLTIVTIVSEERNRDIPVVIDGLPVSFPDVHPQIKEGRTLVPFRAVAEALRVEVDWDGETRTITAKKGDARVKLQVDEPTAYINEKSYALDVAPTLFEGRTLVPLRFFSEAFGCDVSWLGPDEGVQILTPPQIMQVIGFYALGSSWTNLFGKAYPEHGPERTKLVSELALGWYSVDREGNITTRSRTGWWRPDGWERVLELAEEYDLRTEMVVHEGDEEGTVTSFLESEEAVERAVKSIKEEVQIYDGVNINLEGLGLTGDEEELKRVRDKFTRFITRLFLELQGTGKTITLTLHPPNSWYQGYDYEILGLLADRIIVMAHDYGMQPEPMDKVEEAMKMALEHVPPEKLALAISIPSESTESIIAKVGLVKRWGLQGISLWRLGLLPEEKWEKLDTLLEAERTVFYDD